MSFNPYFPVHNYPYGSQPEFAPSWLLGEYNRLVTFINDTLGSVVLPTASEITYNDGATNLGEITVQGAIEKLKTLIDNIPSGPVEATNVEYDNSYSQLHSTNVQNAINELLSLIQGIPVISSAYDLYFSPITPYVTSTNVQNAIGELVNMINAIQPNDDASDINFDKTGTTLSATNVQNAIVELLGLIGNIPVIDDASDVEYDNTGTTLSATNVQNAISELLTLITNIPINVDATDINFDKTGTTMSATNVQNAIIELLGLINNIQPNDDASDINFNKTGTTLSSTNVQNAIVELLGLINNIPTGGSASNVTYDNTQSGLPANNVQGAIDELKDAMVNLPLGSGLEIVDATSITPGVHTHADSENMPLMQKLIDAYTYNKAVMIKKGNVLAIIHSLRVMNGTNLEAMFYSVYTSSISYYRYTVVDYADSTTRYIKYSQMNSTPLLAGADLPTLIYPNSYSHADIMNDTDLDSFVYNLMGGENGISRFKDTNGTYWNYESVSTSGTDKTVKLSSLAGGNIHILTFVVHNYEDWDTYSLDTSETTI